MKKNFKHSGKPLQLDSAFNIPLPLTDDTVLDQYLGKLMEQYRQIAHDILNVIVAELDNTPFTFNSFVDDLHNHIDRASTKMRIRSPVYDLMYAGHPFTRTNPGFCETLGRLFRISFDKFTGGNIDGTRPKELLMELQGYFSSSEPSTNLFPHGSWVATPTSTIYIGRLTYIANSSHWLHHKFTDHTLTEIEPLPEPIWLECGQHFHFALPPTAITYSHMYDVPLRVNENEQTIASLTTIP